MKYKFRWLSLILTISVLSLFYFEEDSSSLSSALAIFLPIFLIWMIWACCKILIYLKRKIFPTKEEAILDANNKSFNRQVYGNAASVSIAAEHNDEIAKNELTSGKALTGILKSIFSFVLLVTSSETSSSKKSSKKTARIIRPRNYGDRDKAIEWEFDGKYLKPRYHGVNDKTIEWEFDGEYLKPCNYSDRDKAIEWEFDGKYLKPRYPGVNNKTIEWEFDGEYLKPRNYGDRDKAIEWEFDGEYLKPRNYGDRDKAIEWEYDSDIPIPVLAKASGII